MMNTNFHLSLPTGDIEKTKNFYTSVLGCKIGRNENGWFDVDFFGNQITFTANNQFTIVSDNYQFDDQSLPTFHFGVIVDKKEWDTLLDKMDELNEVTVSPIKFLENKSGEHESFFVTDPNGYYIEFKKFTKSQDKFAG